MQYRLVARRTTAVLLPAAMLLGSASPALAVGKPVRPTSTLLMATPANPTKASTATFQWAPKTGLHYACSLDGAARTACDPGQTYTGLVAGTHSFVLRTISNQNKRFASTSYSWSVDTTPPVVTVQPVAGPTSSTTASISFSAGDSRTVVCTLDGVVLASCTSPMSVSGLASGTHAFTVTGTDAAGNTSAATARWVVDLQAPSIPVVTPAATLTNATGMNLTFTAEETPTCAVDGASFTPCVSPVSLTGLSEGRHRFAVTSQDAAGNASTGSASWVEDLTPPTQPFLVTSPASPTNDTNAAITYAVDGDTAVVDCTLDGAVLSPCPTSLALPNLAVGDHTVVITPRDAAGNVGQALPVSWTINPTVSAPAEVLSGPPAQTSGTSVTFEFDTFNDTDTGFLCSIDGGTAATCFSGTPITVVGDGPHTLTVTALDANGAPAATTTYNFVIDTVPPAAPTVVSESVDPVTGAYDLILDVPADVTSLTCLLDGVATPCSSILHLEGLAAGDHTLTVIAADAAGNTTTLATRTFTVPVIATTSTGTSSTDPAATTGTSSTGTAAADPAATTGTSSTGTSSADPAATSGTSSTGTTSTDPAATTGTSSTGTAAADPAATTGTSSTGTSSADPAASTSTSSAGTAAADPASSASTSSSSTSTSGTPSTATPVQGTSTSQEVSAPDVTAPHATVVTTSRLVGEVATVLFDEDVLGASATSVRLAAAGSSALATTVRCFAADGLGVSCAGPVRTVALTPTAALVPGQRYAVGVSTGVTDAAGNAAILAPTLFRAALLQQESSPAITGAWRSTGASTAFGGRYGIASLAGASASYAFTGTRVTWFTKTSPAMGKARVYVDGLLKATVNNWSAGTRWKVARSISGLTAGAHRLTVVVAGLKGAASGTGTSVVVDAVRAGSTTVVNPALTTTWATVGASRASGQRFAVADRAGEYLTMRFSGTRLTWQTVTAATMGKARVYVDGVLKGTYDNFSSSTRYGVRRSWTLTNGLHVVKVVVVGAHRKGASGNRVAVDALIVG